MPLAAIVPRHTHDLGAEYPAVVVDRVVTDHLEVLGLTRRGRIRLLLIEGVGHAHPLDRLLRNAVHHLGLFQLGRLEYRWHDVDDMVELVADAALVLDHFRPGDGHALLGAAEVRRHHLGPGKRRVEGPCPGHRHMRIGHIRAPGIIEVLQLILHRQCTPWTDATSFGVPSSPPSALVPLSPLI